VTFAGARSGGELLVRKIDVSPRGGRLVALGNFTTVNGKRRPQLVVVSLSHRKAWVADWATSFFAPACNPIYHSYVRDLDISPDGTYIVVSTTGGLYGPGSPCDLTARFELDARGAGQVPTWRDYAGGDTTYAVEVTGSAVYVGGHFQFQNDPFSRSDTGGPGAVPREGIAALDPLNGLPLSWNPGRTRGVGVFDMLATPSGLWVGSDTRYLGEEYHARLGFFPLRGGSPVPSVAGQGLPADVYLAGRSPQVLYRVNAGGPRVRPADESRAWHRDTARHPARHDGGSTTSTFVRVKRTDRSVPAGTPRAVFRSERRDRSGGPPMRWHFPVAAGTAVSVRMLFAEHCGCARQAGRRVFDVRVDGQTRLGRYDIVKAAGWRRGTSRVLRVTSDGRIDLTFVGRVGRPLVNAIEVTRLAVPPAADDLRRRTYDGADPGDTSAVPSDKDWRQTRGAVLLNRTLYTGWASGGLYARSFAGADRIGTARRVDLHGLAELAGELRRVTGLFYDRGRLYYTLRGRDQLFYRYFTVESEVVGAERFVAAGSVPGLHWRNTAGMFRSGARLFVASAVDGRLAEVGWRQGSLQGRPVVVSSRGRDGHSWAARALFLAPTVG
jgi:hypothetical protein